MGPKHVHRCMSECSFPSLPFYYVGRRRPYLSEVVRHPFKKTGSLIYRTITQQWYYWGRLKSSPYRFRIKFRCEFTVFVFQYRLTQYFGFSAITENSLVLQYSALLIYIFTSRAPAVLGYCSEIRQMFTFHNNLYCTKAYHRPDHSIHIVEHHRKIIIPKYNIFTGPRTQETFSGLWFLSCNLVFETNNFGIGAILLSCLVSTLQELSSPGLELGTASGYFDVFEVSSWSQEISVPNLVQIGVFFVML
jgi:hypothetical protein